MSRLAIPLLVFTLLAAFFGGAALAYWQDQPLWLLLSVVSFSVLYAG